jgi:hypothetical protein
MDKCRIYVCEAVFGRADECRAFETKEEYWRYMEAVGKDRQSSFQPVCSCWESLDAMRLSLRSGKIRPVSILR